MTDSGAGGPVRLRPLQPGDLGWVISRHGALYAAEWGLDASFEVAVAEIVVGVMRGFNPDHDAAWIAERDGAPVGSIFLIGHGAKSGATPETAKLRMLIVDPAARGCGAGRMLTDAAIAFARAHRYRRITLWTMSMLTAARAIYAKAGFRLVAAEDVTAFGCAVTDETWELDLTA